MKIFISHRHSDQIAAEALVDFLEDLQVPSEEIVCTSVPGHLVPNGEKVYDWLRKQFDTDLHVIFLLSHSFYKSPDCLNEMGAAWVTKAKADAILLPGFNPEDISGCLGKDTIALHCGGDEDVLKERIKLLRNTICEEFGLKIPDERRWNSVREKLIGGLRRNDPSEPETEGD